MVRHIASLSAWIALGRLSRSRPTLPSTNARTSSVIVRSSALSLTSFDTGLRQAQPLLRMSGLKKHAHPEEPPSSTKRRLEGSLAQQFARDDDAHDLVRAFEDAVDTQVAEETLHRVILEITVTTVQLERAVDHGTAGIRRQPFRHRGELGLV